MRKTLPHLVVHTVHSAECKAKLIPTSTRKNAARCSNERFTKYGNRCKKHSTLTKGSYFACMFKKTTGPYRGKFCNNPLQSCHKLLCANHATCRANEQRVLSQAIKYISSPFQQVRKNIQLPDDVLDHIQSYLYNIQDLLEISQRVLTKQQPSPTQPNPNKP